MQVCESTHGSKTDPNPGFNPPTNSSVCTFPLSRVSSFAAMWFLCVNLSTNWSTMQAQKQQHTSTNEWQRGNAHTEVLQQLLPLLLFPPPPLSPLGALSGWRWITGWAKHPKGCMIPPTHCSNSSVQQNFTKTIQKLIAPGRGRTSFLPLANSHKHFHHFWSSVDLFLTQFNLVNPTGRRGGEQVIFCWFNVLSRFNKGSNGH